MSRENITAFLESATNNPELQQKIVALHVAVERATAEELAKLSQDAGTPFTAEEWLGEEGELSEAEMEGVAGGRYGEMLLRWKELLK